MDQDNDILSVADLADALKMTPSEALTLFENGEIPGRRIGNRWYLTRRQLIHYIEGGNAAPPKPAADGIDAYPRAPRPGNAWVCERCGRTNNPERVVCQDCGAERIVPLVNYAPLRRSS